MSRRAFCYQSSQLGLAALAYPYLKVIKEVKKKPWIACQQYTLSSYYRRAKKDWSEALFSSSEKLISPDSRLAGLEPFLDGISELGPALQKANILFKSAYTNAELHEPELAKNTIADILKKAKVARKFGVEILVTNPSPIQWGKPIDKNDQQLRYQAVALDTLGAELRKIGVQLAYHTHDPEMRQSAREFHHMLINSKPKNVKLCLDAHWIYRGAGNSEVALMDIIHLYGDRIIELHLRQSHDGIWSEAFGAGDIDYPALFSHLKSLKLKPHIVLEQAVEKKTPHKKTVKEAIHKSGQYIARELTPILF
ncbi:MAG: sugar phosphate isomerase/epimerase [Bacteroidota bacterium]